MSLIVIPSALRNRLWARARARGAGSWVIVCSRRSRWVSSRGWTYRTVGTLSFGVASETKVWITWYTGGYYAKKLLVRHLPHVLAVPRSRHGQMHWPIALVGDADPVPETGLPPGHREALDLAATTPWAREPKAALDPNPPMPAQALEMGHQFRIGKAPIG